MAQKDSPMTTCATWTEKSQIEDQSSVLDRPSADPAHPVKASAGTRRCPTCRNDERVRMRFGRSNVQPFPGGSGVGHVGSCFQRVRGLSSVGRAIVPSPGGQCWYQPSALTVIVAIKC